MMIPSYNGAYAPYSEVLRFFLGPLGLDSGRLTMSLRKWVSSNLSKKSNNPHPSPTDKGSDCFGLSKGTNFDTI